MSTSIACRMNHARWIAVRRTTLGGLVLGFGFLWSDLACYTVGIGLGMVLEWGMSRVHRLWTNLVTWPL